MGKKTFFEYLNNERKAMEDVLARNNALDAIPEKIDNSLSLGYMQLAIIYRLQGEDHRYKIMIRRVVEFINRMEITKEPEYIREEKFQTNIIAKTDLLRQQGGSQIHMALFYVIAREELPKARQLFEWAQENCILPEEYLREKEIGFDNIACAYLWRGYALLSLERYTEALDCLVKVAPILENVTKSGQEMWRIVEYALTKAVVPLCEFKLNPTKDNLKKAQKGIEVFIKSLHNDMKKLDAYPYYFHLKEQFADVYSADLKKFPATASIEEIPRKVAKPVDLHQKISNEGSVIILDPSIESDAFAIIGTNGDFDRFIRYITDRGNFPELASLIDLYTLGNPRDAKELEDDCTRFIRTPGIDPGVYEIGKRICSAVRVAARADSQIMIEYQAELDPQNPG